MAFLRGSNDGQILVLFGVIQMSDTLSPTFLDQIPPVDHSLVSIPDD
jgi:hypothetical protein